MTGPKLLLHTCCAPCLSWPAELLADLYSVTGYFYNPNIHPLEEYERRRDELISFVENINLALIIEKPDFENWFTLIKGLEDEKEGGNRCWKCYEMRLEKTALFAKANDFKLFTTVLSVSPYKNSEKINEIGTALAKKYDLTFVESNFKKNDGFKKSCELSRKFNLYRQNYCGCQFSIRKK
jgi:epoxyqueuosine reductase